MCHCDKHLVFSSAVILILFPLSSTTKHYNIPSIFSNLGPPNFLQCTIRWSMLKILLTILDRIIYLLPLNLLYVYPWIILSPQANHCIGHWKRAISSSLTGKPTFLVNRVATNFQHTYISTSINGYIVIKEQLVKYFYYKGQLLICVSFVNFQHLEYLIVTNF